MLQTIREHTQGWIAGAIVSIIILSFALWGIHSYFIGGTNNTIVATVNGVDISKEQLAVTYERLRRELQIQYGSNRPVTPKNETILKEKALQSLIDNEVLKQSSLKQGFLISDEQIDNYLESLPAFQVDGKFSIERFQEILSSTLLSTSEFLELIKASLLIDQPKLGVVLTSIALPDETTYTIGLVNQERNIDYILVPSSLFLVQPINISKTQINEYYNTHQADFMTPEQVSVDYIELSLKNLSSTILPTENMLRNFYNENVNSYMQPLQNKFAIFNISVPINPTPDQMKIVQNRVDSLLKQLDQDTDITKILNENPKESSITNWMTQNEVPEEWQKATAMLTKLNQISEPFKTSKGITIIKVVDIKEPKLQPFEAVKDKVKDSYIRQHAEEKFAEIRDRLADLAYEHPESLQFAASNLNLPIKTSELFSKEKAGVDISQYKKVRDIAFSNDVLNLQNNSDIIQINPELVIVLRAKTHVSSRLVPLNSIEQQIENKLKTIEADNRAKQLAQQIKDKLFRENPQNVADFYHLTWSKAGFLGRYSNKIDTAILDLAFRLPNPKYITKKKVYGVTRIPNGYAVVALNDVKDGVITDQKQYDVFSEQLQNSEGILEYSLYKASQTRHAKIKVFN